MTELAPAVQGDVNDFRSVTLHGVEDLTAVTAIETHVWKTGTTPLVEATLATTIVDATERTARIELGGVAGWLATAAPGTWFLEVEATFGDGTVLTWPAKGSQNSTQNSAVTLAVRADSP